MRYFEDYRIGERFRVGVVELNREDIIEFAQKWDPQPFHLDDDGAEKSIFGELIASGCHLMSLAIGLISRSPYRGNVLAALQWDYVKFLAPGRPGDLLTMETECIEARLSRSRPDRGIVRNRCVFINQSGEKVLEFVDTIFVGKRSSEQSLSSPA